MSTEQDSTEGVVARPVGRVLSERDGRYGSLAMGKRKEFAAQVRGLVEAAGDEVREEFAAPTMVRLYCEAIKQGLEVRDRTCLNLYSQVMKLVGEERRVTVEFIHSLGVQSEQELRTYIERGRSVEGVGPHDGAERCAAYLEAYLRAFPEQRETLVRRLGGLVAVSDAERV